MRAKYLSTSLILAAALASCAAIFGWWSLNRYRRLNQDTDYFGQYR